MGLENKIIQVVLMCFIIQIIVDVPLHNVTAAPNLRLDTTRIYHPHELDDLLRATAYENCKRDPNCNANNVSNPQKTRCVLGPGTDTLTTMVSSRTGSVRRCNPFTGEVIWPPTGECVTLLSQGPCPADSWVKLTVPELDPVCERRPCMDAQVLTDNRCVNMQDETSCPVGMILANNEFGQGECDCNHGTAYHTLTGKCYKPYSQGPCSPGYIIKVTDSETVGNAECFPNLCPQENMVMISDDCQVQETVSERRGTCYTLGTTGPCARGRLTIDEVLLEPLCLIQTDTHSIFNLPNIRGCPRGSIRDSQGRCRKDFSKVFRRPTQIVTSRPGTVNGTLCPKGQLFLGGNCYRFPSRRDTPNTRRPDGLPQP